MIYTVAFNPSIDYVIFTNDFKTGGLNRATATCKFTGRKGINVSHVLKISDVESTALGFAGGLPGKFIIDTLDSSAIQSNFTEVDEDTRINVKLKIRQEAGINAPGPHITSTQFERLLQQIKGITNENIVIVAGGVPSSIPNDVYAQITQITTQTDAKLVVDAEKGLARSVLPYHPLFIRPDKDELEVTFSITVNSDTDVIKYGRSLVDKGAQSAIVSFGGDGAIYISKETDIKTVNPQGKVVNTVGSGNSTVADMVAGIASGLTVKKALQQAVACGTATTFDEDPTTWDAVEKIKSQVTISVLDREQK